MKSKTKNLTLFFCVIVFISCDFQRVELEYPYPEKTLVLQAFLVPNNTAYTMYPGQVIANITQLHSLNELHNKDTIANAFITMTDSNGQTDTLGYYPDHNDYRADVVPDSNQTYFLKVVCDSFPVLYAEDVLPVKVELDSVQIEPFVRLDKYGASIGQANIYFKDPVESENYYEVEITRGYGSNVALPIFSDDPVITKEFYYPENIEMQNYGPHYFLFSDQSFGLGQQVITVSFYSRSSTGSSGNIISAGNFTVKFRSVSKNYYTYFASHLDYMFNISGEPLLGTREPINILGNVKNGYGVFGAYQEVYFEKYFEEIKY